MKETRLPSDLIDLLAVFADIGVEYLLIGGQALALLGLPRFTKDADIWLRDTPDNLAKAQRALDEFGAPPDLREALLTADPLDVLWMGAPPARIDLMKGVPGGDFERAWDSRRLFQAQGAPISVINRQELIVLKRASGRPQDLVDVANLDKLGD